METFVQEYLIWIIAAVGAWLMLGMILKLARSVINIGCSLIAVIVLILILVNLI